MRCLECSTEMWPIIVIHYSDVWLWECPRCGTRFDLRTGKWTLIKVERMNKNERTDKSVLD